MKHLFSLALVACFFLTACSSDEPGPRGPEGPPGPPGDGGHGAIIEVQESFTADNDYSLFTAFSDFTDVEVLDTDVVQVYLLAGQDGEAEGEPVDVWRALPQTYYENGGTVMYNYDYTYFDVNIFLDSDLDLGSLGPEFTDNQVFRIAIIPGVNVERQNLDLSNYHEVMSALEIQESHIPKLELQ